ncbi:MAG: CDP-alcohol phosphatidyltransferase family protein [Frankiales bacterium]|jgi:CDP-diacylglycerol--glycerol-3-phosphate 3-phosphatidyltransferase|nr:CDP-alcohol phosphatidyltransferase family protein [Frankiales bacterium]
MLNLRVRPALARVVDPVATALLRAGVSPDAITVAGTLGAVLGALVFFPQGMFFTGTAIVFFCVLTDLLDGAMARRLGRTSRFGAWLDSTCDRVADSAIFSGVALWYLGDGDSTLLGGVALFCLVAGSTVSYAKARAEGLGMTCDVGLAERAERLIVVLLGTLLVGLGLDGALPVCLWVLAAATAITVVQRLVEVRRQAALPLP